VHDSILLLAQAPGGSGTYANLLLVAGLAVMMYFVMIRPQQKQMAQHRALLASLKKGDDVTTIGGIVGKVHVVAEREVTLEIANGVRIRVLKTAVNGKLGADPVAVPAAGKADEKREEK
jgi:preprotein translocase subunit YajC